MVRVTRKYVQREVARHEEKVSRGWKNITMGNFALPGTYGDTHVWWEWKDSVGFLIKTYTSSTNKIESWTWECAA